MDKQVRIGKKVIGSDVPCFIIAEAGVNHNGDVGLAKKLIDAAVESGADAVKFQTFHAESLVTETAEKAEYQKAITSSEESQYAMLKRLELPDSVFYELAVYAANAGIIFLSTPFDEQSVDLLHDLGIPAFKIPSGEITNQVLLKRVAGKHKPVILSTGMATLGEIEYALKVLISEGSQEIVLLHCTTSYPASMKSVNLRAMNTLQTAFRVPVGYSDHTEGIIIPVAAVALGAKVIEKHFTLDRNLHGPDHQASLDPAGLSQMVSAIRGIEQALGDGVKGPVSEEERIKEVIRKSIVTKRDIRAGEIIGEHDLTVKRPGTGISPEFFESLIGKRAKRDIWKNRVLSWDQVE